MCHIQYLVAAVQLIQNNSIFNFCEAIAQKSDSEHFEVVTFSEAEHVVCGIKVKYNLTFYVTCSDVLKEDSEDDGDEDEDDEGSDDDDVDTDEDKKHASKPPSQSAPSIYTVLSEFKGEQEGDLSVQVKLQRTEMNVLKLSSHSLSTDTV